MLNGAGSPDSSDATAVGSFIPMAIDTAYDIALPIDMVQEWIDDPTINFGLLFLPGTATEHVHIATREAGAAWAKLSVDVY